MVAGRAREEVGDAEEEAHAQQDGQREVLTARHCWNVGRREPLSPSSSLDGHRRKEGEDEATVC